MYAFTLFKIADISVFIIANLTNLLLTVMFIYRARGRSKTGNTFGWLSVGLGIPLFVIAMFNAVGGRPWWAYVLPGLLVLYDMLELAVDQIWKFDFRHSRWLGPYLGIYYLSLMAMIGYAFIIGKAYGFITLITYFINLAATAYSYARVQHG